jgi:hypothetical protein
MNRRLSLSIAGFSWFRGMTIENEKLQYISIPNTHTFTHQFPIPFTRYPHTILTVTIVQSELWQLVVLLHVLNQSIRSIQSRACTGFRSSVKLSFMDTSMP